MAYAFSQGLARGRITGDEAMPHYIGVNSPCSPDPSPLHTEITSTMLTLVCRGSSGAYNWYTSVYIVEDVTSRIINILCGVYQWLWLILGVIWGFIQGGRWWNTVWVFQEFLSCQTALFISCLCWCSKEQAEWDSIHEYHTENIHSKGLLLVQCIQ